ncbi:Stealth CR1 domain-containing protein [Phyllobacterium leguminum]|uniref:Stealth-like protein n=1 Tax=Phyllobacterium leguminum TaxID=314237 RepID=A0A318T585_9HYPH|nr:Stealth CR1 domain-containing protein [Phyllobacterium leguminum]PYE87411.1 Stealth-like protein [Phyllobacterium leguminum]
MKIDYVIAWVDGQDPKHIAARQEFAPVSGTTHFEATTSERYTDNGEIYYHIASVIKYAPFIRRILIVTDNQKPEHLDSFITEGKCDPSFLKIVSHDDIFAGLNAVRPNFNARTIAAALWRIPSLSEHFIYANDDFFLNAPLQPADFYRDELPLLHGVWDVPENTRWKYKFRQLLGKIPGYQHNLPRYRLAQWKGAVLAGMSGRFLNVHHYPHPLRRSTLQLFFSEHPDVLNRQISFRYRDIAQFDTVSLANHLEITRHGVAVSEPMGLAYVDAVKGKKALAALEEIRIGATPYGCVQGFELFEPNDRATIHGVLAAKFADVLPIAIKQAMAQNHAREDLSQAA